MFPEDVVLSDNLETCDSPFEADDTNSLEEGISIKCSIDPDRENDETGSDAILQTNSSEMNSNEKIQDTLDKSKENVLQTCDNYNDFTEERTREDQKKGRDKQQYIHST